MSRTGREVIELLYWPFVITALILYVLFYNTLREISELIINFAPAFIFIFGSILAYDKRLYSARRLVVKKEIDKTITITKYDILWMYFTMISGFALVLILPIIFKSSIGIIDFFQALVVFLSVYWIRRRYFHYHMVATGEGEYDLDNTIVITYFDTMKIELLSFLSATVIVAVPGILFQSMSLADVFQAIVAFVILYWIGEKYFRFD